MANLDLFQINQEKFIEANDCKEITNPIMFQRGNAPTSDGLLSYEIFGITQEERSGIYGYIDLKRQFIQPYFYKIWLRLDKNLKHCVYETLKFKISDDGYLVPDENGETGVDFLIKNQKKLNFKKSKQDTLLKALLKSKQEGNLFTSKFVVTPPFFRDVDTKTGGRVGVGEINKLYISLINQVKALKDTALFGLDISGGARGKIQDTMLQIYNWFTIGEAVSGGEHTGAGLFKKFGLIRRAGMSKTTDNSARLVISAPNIDVNRKEDLMVDMDHCAAPLSAVLVVAYPFIIHELNRWVDSVFGGRTTFPTTDDNGMLKLIELNNPQLVFSNDRFDAEINEFVHGWANRLKPIKVPTKDPKIKEITLRLKSIDITETEYAKGIRTRSPIIDRDLTWVDLFYQIACKVTSDKTAIITRYPIDSYFNQIYQKIHISSTVKTQPAVIEYYTGEKILYKWYPLFYQKDIGKNTSNMFIDTMSFSNTHCPMMGADYDGDQITFKMAYSVEANQELRKYINSKAQFITLSGNNGKEASNEALQAIYNLTLVLPDDVDKMTKNIDMG